jgi:hypothetical protein
VPRTRLDLLPHYGRFLSSLDRVLKDVAPVVVQELQREFRCERGERAGAAPTL